MKKTPNLKTFIDNFAISLNTQISNMANSDKVRILVQNFETFLIPYGRARETLLRPRRDMLFCTIMKLISRKNRRRFGSQIPHVAAPVRLSLLRRNGQ